MTPVALAMACRGLRIRCSAPWPPRTSSASPPRLHLSAVPAPRRPYSALTATASHPTVSNLTTTRPSPWAFLPWKLRRPSGPMPANATTAPTRARRAGSALARLGLWLLAASAAIELKQLRAERAEFCAAAAAAERRAVREIEEWRARADVAATGGGTAAEGGGGIVSIDMDVTPGTDSHAAVVASGRSPPPPREALQVYTKDAVF
ncbi:hypothetical protein HK405_012056 [Cladochytrium tenue]|nr:hypothetical protein HK405_012056 [Cladochytrium tenue]